MPFASLTIEMKNVSTVQEVENIQLATPACEQALRGALAAVSNYVLGATLLYCLFRVLPLDNL